MKTDSSVDDSQSKTNRVKSIAEIRGGIPFVALPAWIFRKQAEDGGWLSGNEISVLMSLQFFASGTVSGQSVYPSYKTICAYANISRRTAGECINSLQKKGLIRKEERVNAAGQTSNLYHLMYWNDEPPRRFSQGGTAASVSTPTQEPPAPYAGSASEQEPSKQEPSNQDKPIEAPASRPVASGVCKEKVKPKSKAIQEKAEEAILQIPEEYHKYKDILVEWFIARKRRYRKDPEFTRPSLEGLENAKAYDAKCPGILKEYLQKAAYAGWLSLGWTGHVSDLEKMYRDKQILSRNNPQTPLPLIKPKATLG